MKNTYYNIGKKNFTMEKIAEKKLDYYRVTIAQHFKDEDTEEAIEDIDLAIIEKIEEKLKERTDKTVISSDIEEIIRQLGTVEQITDQQELGDTSLVTSKKLYRDINNRWIGGVCSGLAVYIGIPTWIVRLAFLIGIPAPITSILPYLLLWYLVSPTQNKADELQMYGIPVSLSSLSNKQGYTSKKVINLAKALSISLALGSLIFTSLISITMSKYILNSNSQAGPILIYEYQCKNKESATIAIPKYNDNTALIRYNQKGREYFKLYITDQTSVFGSQSFLDQDPLQYQINTSTLDLEIYNKDKGEIIDICEVSSIKQNNYGDKASIGNIQDIITIDECLNNRSLWDYKNKECSSQDTLFKN